MAPTAGECRTAAGDVLELPTSRASTPRLAGLLLAGRGLHSFPFQLNVSSPVHHITQPNSCMCPGFAQVMWSCSS